MKPGGNQNNNRKGKINKLISLPSFIDHFQKINTEKNLIVVLILLIPVQLAKHFWPDFAYIAGIRSDYLSPKIYLTDFIVFALVVNYFLKFRENNNWMRCKITKKNTVMLIALAMFILTNIILSNSPSVSTLYWLRVVELTAIGIVLIKSQVLIVEELKNMISIPLFYSSVIAITQWFKQQSVGGLLYWLGERRFSLTTPGIAKLDIHGQLFLRPYATFPHPNALAGFLLLGLIILVGKRKKRKFDIVVIALSLITLILTFSQASWVIGLILLAAWIVKAWRTKVGMVKYVALSMVMLGVVLLKQIPAEQESVVVRRMLLEKSIELFSQRPLIGVGLGVGLLDMEGTKNNLLYTSTRLSQFQPTHNIAMLVLSEGGIVLFMVGVWVIVKSFRKAKVENKWTLLTALLVIIFTGMLDHYWLTLYQNQLMVLFILAAIWNEPSGKDNALR